MPQNILDEAYNESESYLAEQQKRNVGKFDDEVEKGSIMAESIASTSDVEKPSTSVIQPKYVRESGTESKGTEEESQMMNDDDMFEFLIPKNDEQNAAGSNEHCNMSDNDPLPTFDQPCQSSQKGSNENDRMTSSFEDSYAALQQLADVSDEQLLVFFQ